MDDVGVWPGVRGHAGSTGTDTNTTRVWRSAVWEAMSSLITRAVFEGALLYSSVFGSLSSHVSVLRGDESFFYVHKHRYDHHSGVLLWSFLLDAGEFRFLSVISRRQM